MCTEKQKLYIINNPAFSKRYLDYEIPDYCEIIDQTATIIIDENRSVTINYAGETRSLSGEELFAFLTESLNSNRKFVCYDAVDTHKKLLEIAASANDRRIVWDLSAKFSLWGLGILEQEIVWSTQSRAISFPNVLSIIQKYPVPTCDQHESLREVLRRQFRFLIENLPYLKNDYVGRRIFREHEYASPYIDPTERIVTRRNVHFKERLWPFIALIDGWKRFGPAAVGIEVQGAIAASQLSQALSLICADPEYYLGIRNNLTRCIDEKLASCYPNSSPSCDPNSGKPLYKNKAGKKIAQIWWNESAPSGESSRQFRLYPFDPCSEDTDQAADYQNPLVWGDNIPMAGPLRQWADYSAVSKTWYHTAEKPQEPLIYESMPFLGSEIADYVARSNGQSFLHADPGHKLLEIQIESLDVFSFTWCSEMQNRGMLKEYLPLRDDDLLPESYQPTSFDEEQFELAHIRGNVIQHSSNVDGWDNLAYLDNLKIISEPTNVQPFAYAILTGILKPDILLDQRSMIEKYGELNEAISQLCYEFANHIDMVSESEDVSDCLSSYVKNCRPGCVMATSICNCLVSLSIASFVDIPLNLLICIVKN